MAKKYFLLFSFSLISIVLIGQLDQSVFSSKQLGMPYKRFSYGEMDGGMGKFSLKILEYTFSQENDSVHIIGKVLDKDTKDLFCGVHIFIGLNNIEKKKIKIVKDFNVDCEGNFQIDFVLLKDYKLYFSYISYSILECSIYDINTL